MEGNPLSLDTPQDREAFLKWAMTVKGVPKEQAFAELAAHEKSIPQPLREPPVDPVKQELEQIKYGPGRKEEAKRGIQAGAMALGAMIGGPLAETYLAPALGGAVASTLGEFAGGAGAGMLTGVPPKEAIQGGALGATAGLAARGLAYGGTRLAGKMAGVSKEGVKAAINDMRLLQRPSDSAELDMAKGIGYETQKQAGITTEPHAYYQDLLASKSGTRIDAAPILDSITNSISGADVPAKRTADKALELMADRFTKRVGPDGKIGLGELDDYIRQNFTDPLKGAYTRGSESEFYGRLMDIRKELVNHLYNALGPGAAPSQEMANRALTTREAVENTFSTGTPAKPSGSGAEKIRAIRSNTGEAQKNREVLAAYDAEYGTNLLQKARNLSIQREWTGDAQADAYAIDSVLQPRRPGFVRGLARPVARFGARVTKGAGTTAAAGAAFASAMNPRNNP